MGDQIFCDASVSDALITVYQPNFGPNVTKTLPWTPEGTIVAISLDARGNTDQTGPWKTMLAQTDLPKQFSYKFDEDYPAEVFTVLSFDQSGVTIRADAWVNANVYPQFTICGAAR
jgi:hypothetical protein